jgi:nitrite reductase (NO-forming)
MRRLVAVGVFFEVALLIIGLTWIGQLGHDASADPVKASATSTEDTSYRIQGDGNGAVIPIELTAEETTQTLADGVVYRTWTFNGTAPAPVIRVHLGDTIHFTLTNDSSIGMSHSIDFHAAQTAWDKNYQPVAPGETKSFDWVARFPGVFMYHCGVPPVLQHIANGMYGAIIVEPDGLAPAREYVLTASEFYPADKAVDGVFDGDVAKMESGDPAYVVFDGMFNRYLDAPLQAKPNELIRLWVLDAGPTLTTAFHVIGALFDHVYPDGNPTNQLNGLQTYNIAPGSGAMFEMRIPDAGMYPFVTHSFAYTGRGSVGVLQVTPDAPPAPKSYPTMGDPFTGGVLDYGSTPALLEPAKGGAGGGGGGGHMHMGPIALEAAISGFTPSDLEATEGAVTLEITNPDAFDHDFTIDELDVKTALPAGETTKVTFQAGPGTYTFYCSIPGHREAGMEGTLTVLPGAGH